MAIDREALIAVEPGSITPNGDEVSKRKVVPVEIEMIHSSHPP